MMPSYEVAIIGGSYAGLSAAMSLGRAGRRVLVLDGGRPCNRQTPHAHNLLTHDGDRPQDIARLSRTQALAYPTVTLLQEECSGAAGSNGAFRISTAAGAEYGAQKILLATGVRDVPMPIEGYAECWGISVLHCPYCHGYEVRNEALAVIAGGEAAFEFSRLIYQWSKNLHLLTSGPAGLTEEQSAKLASRGIAVVESEIAALEHTGGRLRAVLFRDGSRLPLRAVFARGGIELPGDLALQLGCAIHEEGMLKGLIRTDMMGKTSVPGVSAAGDVAGGMRSLSAAMASGNVAGAVLNHELVAEQF